MHSQEVEMGYIFVSNIFIGNSLAPSYMPLIPKLSLGGQKLQIFKHLSLHFHACKTVSLWISFFGVLYRCCFKSKILRSDIEKFITVLPLNKMFVNLGQFKTVLAKITQHAHCSYCITNLLYIC